MSFYKLSIKSHFIKSHLFLPILSILSEGRLREVLFLVPPSGVKLMIILPSLGFSRLLSIIAFQSPLESDSPVEFFTALYAEAAAAHTKHYPSKAAR
jgi:hypothetical protein